MYYLMKILKKLQIKALKNCNIHKTAAVCGGCELLNVQMGKYSYIGYNTKMVNVNIGAFCSIAGDCLLGAEEHPLHWASTSAVFEAGANILHTNFK